MIYANGAVMLIPFSIALECAVFFARSYGFFLALSFIIETREGRTMEKRKNIPWLENAIAYTTEGIVLPCPRCGSTDIEITVLQEGRKSITLVCRKCGDWRHFDGEK